MRLDAARGFTVLVLALLTTEGSAAPAPADSEAPSGSRVRLSGALGAGAAFGDASRGAKVRNLMPTPLVIGLDAAWGPVPSFDLGIASFATLGTGVPAQCPEPTTSCGLATGGFGLVRGRFHFLPREPLDPWVGLGAGIEVLGSRGQTTVTKSGILFDSSTTTDVSEVYVGPVLGALQLGLDYRIRRSFYFGTSAELSVARFTSLERTIEVDGREVGSSSVRLDKTTHQWLRLTLHITGDVGL